MDICGSWTTSAIACLSWNSSLTFGELEPRLPRCGTIRSHLIPAPAQFGCVSELLTYGSRTLCSDRNKPRLEGDHFPKGPRVDACPSSSSNSVPREDCKDGIYPCTPGRDALHPGPSRKTTASENATVFLSLINYSLNSNPFTYTLFSL